MVDYVVSRKISPYWGKDWCALPGAHTMKIEAKHLMDVYFDVKMAQSLFGKNLHSDDIEKALIKKAITEQRTGTVKRYQQWPVCDTCLSISLSMHMNDFATTQNHRIVSMTMAMNRQLEREMTWLLVYEHADFLDPQIWGPASQDIPDENILKMRSLAVFWQKNKKM